MNVIKWVLLKRYEFWDAKGWKTHATTNIDIKKIGINYGGRVADRLGQMCIILNYDILENSFRQVTSVQPLGEKTKAENLEKYYPKKKHEVERVNVLEYINGIIKEPPEQIAKYDIYHFNFIRKHLEENKLIEYTDITDAHIEAAESLARQSIRKGTEALYKNFDSVVAKREKAAQYDALNYQSLMLVAKNAQIRQKLISMHENGETF